MSIAEMIDEFTPDQFVTDVKNIKKDFIIYLLRNSFIDENYFDYISYFYANSLSEDETQYLLLIKNQQNPNFALLVKNSNFSNVIARIKYNEWKLPAVLNYSVLYCILLFDDSHIDDPPEVDSTAAGNSGRQSEEAGRSGSLISIIT